MISCYVHVEKWVWKHLLKRELVLMKQHSSIFKHFLYYFRHLREKHVLSKKAKYDKR